MNYNNQLEPDNLINSFSEEPPIGFVSLPLNVNGSVLPAFITKFDLLTTLENRMRKIISKIRFLIPSPKTLFIGTTVSEYSVFPKNILPSEICLHIFSAFKMHRCSFLIVKDIPMHSPLLSDEENAFCKKLIHSLECRKFMVLCGEALAYVPINYLSVDEYLQKFSSSRRKDFKRKLRSMSELTIETIPSGSTFFTDEIVSLLYQLYENVFNDSDIHFDKLTRRFFEKIFRDGQNNGVTIVYRRGDRIIGFNLCFVVNDRLVDKYVGFQYPESLDYSLYFVSWFYNIDYCIKKGLKYFVAGWTDPKIKKYLGADFTYTYHAVYAKNPFQRFLLRRVKSLFEADRTILENKL